MDYQKGTFTISTDNTKLNISYIHQFLTHSYWAEGIPIEIVVRSIEGSICFGLYDNLHQIGFARVVTDKATFGYLADVFVDEEYRGCGLSKWLMEVIMAYPELQGFRNWMLGTKDAHGLYAQFGFTPLNQPERIMRKNVPHIYKSKS
ncbi:MAG: GNAT family N-acetyltransferase [Ferruginibacter sp.]